MKKILALILIALFIPVQPAQANSSSYQMLTPVLTTTYELPAQTYNSRWRTIEIPFSVILVSDGTVASFHFDLIDAEGFKLSTRELDTPYSGIDSHYSPKTWTQNTKWSLYSFDKPKLPITLRTEIEFWRSTGKASVIQHFGMNFVIHKDDVAEKAKLDAVAKAQADAVAEAKAKAEAEAKAKADLIAKADAELKAKQEAEAKAKAEAESPTWYCTLDTTKTQMTKSKADALCSQILANQKAFEQSEMLKERNIAIIETAKSMYENTRCTKLNSIKAYLDIYKFKCVKNGKVLVWKIQK